MTECQIDWKTDWLKDRWTEQTDRLTDKKQTDTDTNTHETQIDACMTSLKCWNVQIVKKNQIRILEFSGPANHPEFNIGSNSTHFFIRHTKGGRAQIKTISIKLNFHPALCTGKKTFKLIHSGNIIWLYQGSTPPPPPPRLIVLKVTKYLDLIFLQ